MKITLGRLVGAAVGVLALLALAEGAEASWQVFTGMTEVGGKYETFAQCEQAKEGELVTSETPNDGFDMIWCVEVEADPTPVRVTAGTDLVAP